MRTYLFQHSSFCGAVLVARNHMYSCACFGATDFPHGVEYPPEDLLLLTVQQGPEDDECLPSAIDAGDKQKRCALVVRLSCQCVSIT